MHSGTSSGVRRALLAALTTVVIATTLGPAPVRAADAARVPARSSADQYAEQAFAATNAQRTGRDRSKLRESSCLTRVAERWARSMAGKGRLEHQSLKPILRRCDLTLVGENIAVGYPSGKAVVNRGWMHSAGHRENILRPQFRLMGIGAHRDGSGRWWVSQVFGRA